MSKGSMRRPSAVTIERFEQAWNDSFTAPRVKGNSDVLSGEDSTVTDLARARDVVPQSCTDEGSITP